MARLPALVTALSTTDGRERSTIDVIARTVREAGLIATTKRGGGASPMTVNDAVNLIIGANAVQSPRLAAIAAQQYRTYRQSPHGRSTTGRVFSRLAKADTLADALAVLIEDADVLDAMLVDSVKKAHGRYDKVTDWILKPSFTVSFSGAAVDIAYPIEHLLWRFQVDADLLTQSFYTFPGEGIGRRVTTTLLFPTFLAVHDALFGKHEMAAGSQKGAS